MKDANKFFEQFKNRMVGEMYTAAIAQIESYDPIINKADIVVLPSRRLVKSVPVGLPQTSDFYIRMPYQKGDHVIVVFSHRDIDPIIFDSGGVPSHRMLSENDAMIVQGINVYTDPLPPEDADKLVIARKDGQTKIAMGEDTVDVKGWFYVNDKQVGVDPS